MNKLLVAVGATLLLTFTAVGLRANIGPISGPLTFSSQFFFTSGVISLVCGSGSSAGLLDCTQTWTAPQTFNTVYGSLGNSGAVISGTSYTISQAGDCGRTLVFTSSSPIDLTTDPTAPANRCAIAVEQKGSGVVTIVDGGAATHHSRLNWTGTAGQYSYLGLVVDGNSDGSSATYLLTGDGN